jgi:DNA mismatch endonuclease, patch repair protein
MERFLRDKLPDGKFYDVSPKDRRMMQRIRGSGNHSTEARLRAALVRAGIRGWKVNFRVANASPDFYFPKERFALFVDGCFWHGCPICGHIPKKNAEFWKAKLARNRERDHDNKVSLEGHGIIVLRFLEHELTVSLHKCIQDVRTIITQRRTERDR